DIAALNKHEVQLRALIKNGADIAYGPWVKGLFVNLTTEDTEDTEEKAVPRLASQAGAAFSKPSASELARDSENTMPIRSASGPALAAEPPGKAVDRVMSEGGFAPEEARNAAILNSENTLYQLPATLYSEFISEGPVLQARGLPTEDLVKALLTNWSIVPHACLFRRSILEKAGGFPEDIWVGEDQLLFLRCLLAGARVVHTPGTMVYYRLGNDPGKLTATGAAQERHARDWGRFLLKANEEVASDEWRVTSAGKRVPAEAQRRGDFLSRDRADIHGFQKSQQGGAQGTCAGTAFSNPSTSELARDSENTSLIRSADTPASLPATSHPLPATAPKALTTPSAWFGFRLRAYEAWRDLGRFFPDGEEELKMELQEIWWKNRFSVFSFQFSGFWLRKWGGLKLRVLGYREGRTFRCMKFDSENSGSIAGKLPTFATKFL
ncbi:MAG: hypothetical protein ACKOLA_09635, partial [Spartobacteria bacterium]